MNVLKMLFSLESLYGERTAKPVHRKLKRLIERWPKATCGRAQFSQADILLLAYPDGIVRTGEAPLRTLSHFVAEHLGDFVSALHILPFFPSDGDFGFAVLDHHEVDPRLGDWTVVTEIAQRFRLVTDLVLNHVSSGHPWLRRFIAGDQRYAGYFIELSPDVDLSAVARSREHPVLTPFATARGVRYLWTKYGPGQVDLNYRCPDVLLSIIETLAHLVERGVDIIRLDAVAFIWKEIGTSCNHLPQNHAIVQLLRAVLDRVNPGVSLLAETDLLPEAVSYHGRLGNEAQLVYRYELPALLLHACLFNTAAQLTQWVKMLKPFPRGEACINFLGTHDGIYLRPQAPSIPSPALDELARLSESKRGYVLRVSEPSGGNTPYELDIAIPDLLGEPDAGDLWARRYLACYALIMAIPGVPMVYLGNMLGAESDHEAVRNTGVPRAINRRKFSRREAEFRLTRPDVSTLLSGLQRLARARIGEPAFAPSAPCRARALPRQLEGRIFALERGDVLVLINFATQTVDCPIREQLEDIVTGTVYRDRVVLEPYGYAWLRSRGRLAAGDAVA
jgi:glycosidase